MTRGGRRLKKDKTESHVDCLDLDGIEHWNMLHDQRRKTSQWRKNMRRVTNAVSLQLDLQYGIQVGID